MAVKFARSALLRSMKWAKENWASILNWLIAILVIALVVTARVMWNHKDGTDGIYEFLRDVASAFLLLIGAFALLRRAAPQDKIAEADFQSNQQTIFKDGLAFLGDDSESVRLGGIYNLYELAIKNPERSNDVLKILCAHLRSKTNEKVYKEDYPTEPSVEISSLLELLTRKESELRKAVEESGDGKYMLNFRRAFLNGANLQGAWLEGADLSHSQLQKTILVSAQMQMIDLSGAQMQGAKLFEAKMQRAKLFEVQMQGADLRNIQMQEAHLVYAKMQGVDLSAAHMQGANLGSAHMQGAKLQEAQIQGASLDMAYMQGAWLKEAQMHGVSLFGAHMQGANLSMTQMQGVNLKYADMRGTYLNATDLQIAQLNGAKLQGSIWCDVELQGVDLNPSDSLVEVDLRGAGVLDPVKVSGWHGNFKSRMEARQGKSTELKRKVIFSGGLDPEKCEEIKKAMQKIPQSSIRLNKMDIGSVLLKLDSHVGIPASYKIPKKVVTGVLDDEEINQIIEEYEKAMAWKTEDAESD